MQHDQKFLKDMQAECRAAKAAAATLEEKAAKLATQHKDVCEERRQKLELYASLRDVLVKTYKVNPDHDDGAAAQAVAAQGEHKSKPA